MGNLDTQATGPICSVVITAHAEGRVIHRTLRSAEDAIKYAQRQGGFSSEIVIVKDRVSDSPTLEVLNAWGQKSGGLISTYCVDFGSLSLSRNYGIQKAKGRYVSILDGDDLYSQNWLLAATGILKENIADIVHPAVIVGFPFDPYIKKLKVAPESRYQLFEYNQWPALLMAHKEIFQKIPYVKDEGQFAYQDWLWNCQTLQQGLKHHCARETLMAIRQKEPGKSLWQKSFSLNKVVRPNELFAELINASHFKPQKKKSRRMDAVIGKSIDYLLQNYPELYEFLKSFKRRKFRKTPNQLDDFVSAELKRLITIEPLFQNLKTYRTPNDYTNEFLFRKIPLALSAITRRQKVDIVFADRRSDATRVSQYLPQDNDKYRILFARGRNRSAPSGYFDAVVNLDEIELDDNQKTYILLRVLLETSIGRIFIHNSDIGTRLVNKYVQTLSCDKIVVFIDTPPAAGKHIYRMDTNTIEQLSNFDHFDEIIIADRVFKNYIQLTFGIPENKIALN